TAPALWGAIDFCKAYQKANPSHVVVNVLATDGIPQECSPQAIGNANDAPAANFAGASSIASIAAYGVQGNPKILTFVIGVGDQVPNLDTIAAAGGTKKAFLVNDPKMGGQQFLDALNAIRGTTLQCSYQIPVPEAGTPDYNAVNVEYTP